MRTRLLVLALASCGLYAVLATRIETRSGLAFWGIWAALVLGYGLGVRLAATRQDRGLVTIILMGAILARGALLLGSGLDPTPQEVFLYRPSPLTEWVAALGLGVHVERLIATGVDLGALALAPGLLKASRLPVGAAIVHAWNPLVVTEVAGRGRLEVIAFALLLLSLRLIQTGAPWRAALVYGASLGGPFMLVAALPVMARQARARVLVSLGLGLVAWQLAFPQTTWAERTGWPPESALGGSAAPAATALANLFVTRSETLPLAMLFAAWAAAAVWRPLRGGQAMPEALVATGLFVLVSPQTLPWAFVPFAYLGAYSTNRGWIAFTATAPLTYAAIAWGAWGRYEFLAGFAQYFVPYALTIYWWLGGTPSPTRRKRKPASAETKAGATR